ncbi:MAG: FxsA family protein [Pseudomonadota bacterium]
MLLLALFIGIPLLEIALFIQLGSVLDLGWILLIVVLTAVLGTWLVRRQGRDVLRQIQGSFETLNDPTEPLAHGAMILFSGALLLTPGFFTDTIGFLLLIPACREVAFRWLRRRVVVHAARPRGGFRAHGHAQTPRPGRTGTNPRQSGVIDGDYTDVTEAGARAAPEAGATPQSRPRSGRKPSGWTKGEP